MNAGIGLNIDKARALLDQASVEAAKGTNGGVWRAAEKMAEAEMHIRKAELLIVREYPVQ